MSFQTTPAHEDIFSGIRDGNFHMMISAVAGSGKTTTIVEACKFIPTTSKAIFLAFNKKIAVELGSRLPSHIPAKTLNALGFAALNEWFRSQRLPPARLEADKVRTIVHDMLPAHARIACGSIVTKLVKLAKAACIVPTGVENVKGKGLVEDTDDAWLALANHHDVDMEIDDEDLKDYDEHKLVGLARQALRESMENIAVIDFDDQLFLPVAFGARFQKFNWIFVDESQDLSPLQHEMLARSLDPVAGRIVAVGDPCQAIYGFRGADSDSMATMKARFAMREFPLHVSYRCPQAVVQYAQTVVPHIMAHPSAPVGTVDTSNRDFANVEFKAGDMIVSRVSAPLIHCAYNLLRRGIPATVLGRDIGAGLVSLVKRLKAKSIADLSSKLKAWSDRECAKLAAKDGNEEKVAKIADQVATIHVFMEMADSILNLITAIQKMFSDEGSDRVVTLCTVHKSKGLEADRVFVLNRDRMPSKWATKEWQQKQERNLIYVACTRAKKHLQFVKA